MTKTSQAQLNGQAFIRYSRQLMLPEVEEAGQGKLTQAKVLIVGAGGLGSLAAMYLAGAGVGCLTIADGDQLELSNLPRQLAYRSQDLGSNKAQALKAQLLAQNPEIEVIALPEHLTQAALIQAISKVDLVLDCSDNMPTRQAINHACITQQKLLISGAATAWQGQLMVFDFRQANQGCYQCLFPQANEQTQNCRTLGVMGAVVGMIACQQALGAIKAIVGLPIAAQQIQCFDGLSEQWQRFDIGLDAHCPICQPQDAQEVPRV